eukprot:1152801-Pelagomonas_calceolata.AAC.7
MLYYGTFWCPTSNCSLLWAPAAIVRWPTGGEGGGGGTPVRGRCASRQRHTMQVILDVTGSPLERLLEFCNF